MEDFFNEVPAVFKNDFASGNWKGFTPVNVKETNDAFVLDVVAPGLEKNDFKINLDNQVLTISVDKKNESVEEAEKQIRREYSFHSFKRSFTLDEKIDSEKIEAKYVNGVLTLNLPKKAEVKEASKEISVQ
jgi:HSP20 family protein